MLNNPLVPTGKYIFSVLDFLGIIFTGFVQLNGARHMRSGNQMMMQRMMRWRIYGQGASLGLLAYLSVKLTKSGINEIEPDPKHK